MTRFLYNDKLELIEHNNLSIRSIVAKEDQFDHKTYYDVTYEGDGSNFNRSYAGSTLYSEEELPEDEKLFYNFQERIKGKYPQNYIRIMSNCDGTINVFVKGKGANTKTIKVVSGSYTDTLKELGIE